MNHRRPTNRGWYISSYSQNGSCVEVRIGLDEVQVRDSKDPGGPVLSFTLTEWAVFLRGVKKGEFELI